MTIGAFVPKVFSKPNKAQLIILARWVKQEAFDAFRELGYDEASAEGGALTCMLMSLSESGYYTDFLNEKSDAAGVLQIKPDTRKTLAHLYKRTYSRAAPDWSLYDQGVARDDLSTPSLDTFLWSIRAFAIQMVAADKTIRGVAAALEPIGMTRAHAVSAAMYSVWASGGGATRSMTRWFLEDKSTTVEAWWELRARYYGAGKNYRPLAEKTIRKAVSYGLAEQDALGIVLSEPGAIMTVMEPGKAPSSPPITVPDPVPSPKQPVCHGVVDHTRS